MVRELSTQAQAVRSVWQADRGIRRLFALLCLAVLAWIVLSPVLSTAFVGLGGYISEKTLSSGTNATMSLSSGSGPIVLGSGPSISTVAVNDAALSGGVTSATLRGTLTSLNGLPQADVWFVWGYASTLLTNTTATATTAALGAKTAVITGFDSRYNIFYEFRSATDGTSLGGVQHFSVAGSGPAFDLLRNSLTLIIAAGILIAALRVANGNWYLFLIMTTIGFIGITIARALLF